MKVNCRYRLVVGCVARDPPPLRLAGQRIVPGVARRDLQVPLGANHVSQIVCVEVPDMASVWAISIRGELPWAERDCDVDFPTLSNATLDALQHLPWFWNVLEHLL